MTLLPHTSSPSVQIRNGVGMAVSLQGMRVHERLSLPDCTVSLPMLKFALASAPEGYAAAVGHSHLELASTGFSARIPLLVEPELPEPELHQKFSDLDFTAIRRLSACSAARDPAREILEYVKLSGGKAAASNGRVFAVEPGFPDVDMEIHRSYLPLIGDGSHPVSASEKSVCVQLESGTLWLPRWSDALNLVDQCAMVSGYVSGVSAAVKTDDVITAARTASQIAEKIEVLFLADGIQIHTPSSEAYFSQRVIANPSGTAEVCVNPKYFLACLQAVGEEFVDLFISPYSSIAVKGQKAHAVCMGMRKS